MCTTQTYAREIIYEPLWPQACVDTHRAFTEGWNPSQQTACFPKRMNSELSMDSTLFWPPEIHLIDIPLMIKQPYNSECFNGQVYIVKLPGVGLWSGYSIHTAEGVLWRLLLILRVMDTSVLMVLTGIKKQVIGALWAEWSNQHGTLSVSIAQP